jgi:hypothetical protein
MGGAGGFYLDSPKDDKDYRNDLEQTCLFMWTHGTRADSTVG